jgi:hypothetical protein
MHKLKKLQRQRKIRSGQRISQTKRSWSIRSTLSPWVTSTAKS